MSVLEKKSPQANWIQSTITSFPDRNLPILFRMKKSFCAPKFLAVKLWKQIFAFMLLSSPLAMMVMEGGDIECIRLSIPFYGGLKEKVCGMVWYQRLTSCAVQKRRVARNSRIEVSHFRTGGKFGLHVPFEKDEKFLLRQDAASCHRFYDLEGESIWGGKISICGRKKAVHLTFRNEREWDMDWRDSRRKRRKEKASESGTNRNETKMRRRRRKMEEDEKTAI